METPDTDTENADSGQLASDQGAADAAVLRAMEMARQVDKELSNLAAETDMETDSLTQSVVRLRNDIHANAQDADIVDDDVTVRDLTREASEAHEVIPHRTSAETPDDGGNPGAKFEAGLVAKFVYDTHHAPDYVMQLENGHFIRCLAPVETSGEDYPIGAPASKVREKFEADHVTVHWLEKENTPFRARTESSTDPEEGEVSA